MTCSQHSAEEESPRRADARRLDSRHKGENEGEDGGASVRVSGGA